MPTTPGPWGMVLPSKLADVQLRNASPSPFCSVQEQTARPQSDFSPRFKRQPRIFCQPKAVACSCFLCSRPISARPFLSLLWSGYAPPPPPALMP